MITEDYKTITPGDPVWEDALDKLHRIPDDISEASKIEYVEDNPANEGGDASFLFQKVFGGDSYIECYFTYDTQTGEVGFAEDIAGVWDITSDGKNPNTYCAVYIGSNVYVAAVPSLHQKTLFLIGALNEKEYKEMMDVLPEDLSLDQFIELGSYDGNSSPFDTVFIKHAR